MSEAKQENHCLFTISASRVKSHWLLWIEPATSCSESAAQTTPQSQMSCPFPNLSPSLFNFSQEKFFWTLTHLLIYPPQCHSPIFWPTPRVLEITARKAKKNADETRSTCSTFSLLHATYITCFLAYLSCEREELAWVQGRTMWAVF